MPQYDPAAFHEVFGTLTNLPIVGGQAVNLWAEIYGAREVLLDEHRPFLSKDADLFGERRALEDHAVPKGWSVQYCGIPRQMAVALLTKDLPGPDKARRSPPKRTPRRR